MFNARDWYWSVGGDTTKIYSSKHNAYVDPETDADYAVWARGHGPHPTPVESEADIWFYMQEFLPASAWDGTTISKG
jgi:hypothetical protein